LHLRISFEGKQQSGRVWKNESRRPALAGGGTFKTASGAVQTRGDIDLSEAINEMAGYFLGDLELRGGSLAGEGFLGGNLVQFGGVLSPDTLRVSSP
jgi:hypothetical protein